MGAGSYSLQYLLYTLESTLSRVRDGSRSVCLPISTASEGSCRNSFRIGSRTDGTFRLRGVCRVLRVSEGKPPATILHRPSSAECISVYPRIIMNSPDLLPSQERCKDYKDCTFYWTGTSHGASTCRLYEGCDSLVREPLGRTVLVLCFLLCCLSDLVSIYFD